MADTRNLFVLVYEDGNCYFSGKVNNGSGGFVENPNKATIYQSEHKARSFQTYVNPDVGEVTFIASLADARAVYSGNYEWWEMPSYKCESEDTQLEEVREILKVFSVTIIFESKVEARVADFKTRNREQLTNFLQAFTNYLDSPIDSSRSYLYRESDEKENIMIFDLSRIISIDVRECKDL